MSEFQAQGERLMDQDSVDPTPYLSEAMDEAIDRLFSGKSIGRMFLSDYVEKFAEDVAASLIRKDFLGSEKLEALIRRELEDSEEVRELAIEFAGEE